MRSAASCSQPRQELSVPRCARTVRGLAAGEDAAAVGAASGVVGVIGMGVFYSRVRMPLMSVQPKTWLRPDEYLAIERAAPQRSEYIDGEMVAMTGVSRAHSLITTNLARELSLQLKRRPCEVHVNDLRVRIPSGRLYTYPDVVVACGEPHFEDYQLDPLLVPGLIAGV